jgi:hypothetical protein
VFFAQLTNNLFAHLGLDSLRLLTHDDARGDGQRHLLEDLVGSDGAFL